jgi:hypothetical protein
MLRYIPRTILIPVFALFAWAACVGLIGLTLEENIAGFWIFVMPLTVLVLVTNALFGRRW